jgi:hypothetical protein
VDVLVVFGNCQAEAVCSALRSLPALADNYEIVLVSSFGITPEQEAQIVNDDVRNRCTLMFEQVTPLVRLSNRYDFPRARITTFPSLDFNLIWPLRADEPRMAPEPPTFPYGRYTYGDRIINQVVAEGLESDQAWHEFERRSNAAMPNLKRLVEIETRRWTFAERNLDVVMSDVIFPNFQSDRLFWTYNHPNRIVLCRLSARILASAGISASESEAFELMCGILTWEFGADYQAPIHPRVGRELNLMWWDEAMTYRRYDDNFTYEQFIRNHIAWA